MIESMKTWTIMILIFLSGRFRRKNFLRDICLKIKG